MGYRLKRIIESIFGENKNERIKLLILAAMFFLIIGGYTVVRETKDSVFSALVSGSARSYVAWAKIVSMLLLIPILFIHEKLVDRLKKHYLLYFYTLFYGVVGIGFAFLLGHPSIGLANKMPGLYRMCGWFYYLFIEGYTPFIVGLFWAFTNSLTKPESVGRDYTVIICSSKLGAIITSYLAYSLLMNKLFSDTIKHQIIIGCSSFLILLVPVFIYLLMKFVPNKYLHGYEAAYKIEHDIEKNKNKNSEADKSKSKSGLTLLFKYPYVLGIFAMSFFFELVSQALKIENIIFGIKNATCLSDTTGFLIKQAGIIQFFGLIVVAFGTRAIINTLGEKWSLLLIPTVTGIAVLNFIWHPTELAATIAFVVTRAINFAFSVPLRESLYIPTIKEIQFKSKSWIDGFGSKFAKTCAVTFNSTLDGLTDAGRLGVQSIFFITTIITWMFTSYALGKKFENSIEKNEVIGSK